MSDVIEFPKRRPIEQERELTLPSLTSDEADKLLTMLFDLDARLYEDAEPGPLAVFAKITNSLATGAPSEACGASE